MMPGFWESSVLPAPFPLARRQLGFGRGLWDPTAFYLALRVPQTLTQLCLAFLLPEKPTKTGLSVAGLQAGCCQCQMPGTLIWGGSGLLCAARDIPSRHPRCGLAVGTLLMQRRMGPGRGWCVLRAIKTQGVSLGRGKVQSDPQEEAKGLLPAKTER